MSIKRNSQFLKLSGAESPEMTLKTLGFLKNTQRARLKRLYNEVVRVHTTSLNVILDIILCVNVLKRYIEEMRSRSNISTSNPLQTLGNHASIETHIHYRILSMSRKWINQCSTFSHMHLVCFPHPNRPVIQLNYGESLSVGVVSWRFT